MHGFECHSRGTSNGCNGCNANTAKEIEWRRRQHVARSAKAAASVAERGCLKGMSSSRYRSRELSERGLLRVLLCSNRPVNGLEVISIRMLRARKFPSHNPQSGHLKVRISKPGLSEMI